MDLDELGWEPYMKCWIKQKRIGVEGEKQGEKETKAFREFLSLVVEKYVPKVLKVKKM